MRSDSQPLLHSGELVAGRYEICETLGAGGMGWVFRATDRRLNDQSVALKFLYPHLVSDELAFSRFRNEVLVARKLIHPSIIRTFHFDSDSQHAFIVMEHVEGATLSAILNRDFPNGMPAERVIDVAFDIAVGMHHSHSLGIVHRDLKPENVMMTRLGEVKLSDFGLAATLRRQGQLTGTGQLLGTPYYMAPEQFRGETFDARVDIYAFGIMVYELLIGTVPFSNSSLYALALKHEREELFIPPERELDAPTELWDIVRRATRKKPDDRFQEFSEVVGSLEPLCTTPRPIQISTRATSLTEPIAKVAEKPPFRFNRLFSPKLLVADAVILLLVLVVWTRNNSSLRMHLTVPILYAENVLNIRLAPFRSLLAINIEPGGVSLADQMRTGYSGVWPRLMVGEDPNAAHNRLANGNYALHVAIEASHAKATRWILDAHADPNLCNHAGESPLHLAAKIHDIEGAQMLLSAGALPDIVAVNGSTPLLIAAQSNDPVMAMLFLRAGADPLRRDARGWNTLMYAAANGRSAIVKAAALISPAARGPAVNRDEVVLAAPQHLRPKIEAALAAPNAQATS